MKTVNLVLIGVAGIAVYEAYKTIEAANDINVVFAGVAIPNLNAITAKMVVQNVTNDSIQVNSLVGNLLLNGNQLASLSDYTQREIAPNASTEIDITVAPSWLSIPGDVASLVSTPGSQLNFQAIGNVNIANLPVLPFSLPLTVSI